MVAVEELKFSQALGFRVLGFRLLGLRVRVLDFYGSGFRVWHLRFGADGWVVRTQSLTEGQIGKTVENKVGNCS